MLTQAFIGNTFWFEGVPLPAFAAQLLVQTGPYSACQRDFHLGRELLWISTVLIWTSVVSTSLAKKKTKTTQEIVSRQADSLS